MTSMVCGFAFAVCFAFTFVFGLAITLLGSKVAYESEFDGTLLPRSDPFVGADRMGAVLIVGPVATVLVALSPFVYWSWQCPSFLAVSGWPL